MKSPIPILSVHVVLAACCFFPFALTPFLLIVQASLIGVTLTEKVVPWYLKIGLVLAWFGLNVFIARMGYDEFGLTILDCLAVVSGVSFLIGSLAHAAHHLLNREAKLQLVLSDVFVVTAFAAILFAMVSWSPDGDGPYYEDLNSHLAGVLTYSGLAILGSSLFVGLMRKLHSTTVDGAVASVGVIAGIYFVVAANLMIDDARIASANVMVSSFLVYLMFYLLAVVPMKITDQLMADQTTDST